ncbi:MAG: hypothetical protein ILP13_01020 [Lachnospiraceae bacterium]|nr:hypothetical protein [Lachnospiraceae bacterium]
MKKFLSVVLTGALLLSLAACAKTVPADVTGSVSKASVSASTEASTEVKDNNENNSLEVSSADNNAVAAEENKDTENAASTDAEPAQETEAFSIGEIASDVYENEFFNVKVTASEGFRFLSDAEIEALGQATAENISESAESVAKAIEDGSVLTPMYVSDESGLNTLGLNISSLGIASALVNEAAIIDASLDQIVTMLTGSGFENVTAERSTTTFLGKEVDCMIVHGTYMGLDLYEKQVEIIEGTYMASFTATSYVTDTTDALLALAAPLK